MRKVTLEEAQVWTRPGAMLQSELKVYSATTTLKQTFNGNLETHCERADINMVLQGASVVSSCSNSIAADVALF